MPYKDKEKKKQYYQRHQKYYNKKFIEEHRSEWNNYQKEYKVKKRFEVADKIKNAVSEMKISDTDDLTFKATVIFMYVCETGISRASAIAYRTRYDEQDVKLVFQNWQENEIWLNRKFYVEFGDSPLEQIMELTLVSMAGAGILKRTTV